MKTSIGWSIFKAIAISAATFCIGWIIAIVCNAWIQRGVTMQDVTWQTPNHTRPIWFDYQGTNYEVLLGYRRDGVVVWKTVKMDR